MVKDGIPLPPGSAAGPASPNASPHRVLLVGFGHVGRALARSLHEAGHGRPGFPWDVVAVVDSRGAVLEEGGLDLEELVLAKERTGRLQGPTYRRCRASELIAQVAPDVVVEVSVSDPHTGEPGTSHILRALAEGADVVTSNKGPFALRYREVQEAVARSGRRIRYGTTVGGIVPILETLVERLPAARVQEVEAVLNGTTQFVLSRLSAGESLQSAVAVAQARGLTEPNPSWDLGGHDAALKAAILHNALFSPPITADEVPREGVDAGVEALAQEARAQGRTIVLQAHVRAGHAEVALVEVPLSSPWAAPGPLNVFQVTTERAGTLLLQGPGAGAEVTATGLAADLASLETSSGPCGSVPSHPNAFADPWTARASWPPAPPARATSVLGRQRRKIRGGAPLSTARAAEEVRAW
jgi:homoserine dehydrogenase